MDLPKWSKAFEFMRKKSLQRSSIKWLSESFLRNFCWISRMIRDSGSRTHTRKNLTFFIFEEIRKSFLLTWPDLNQFSRKNHKRNLKTFCWRIVREKSSSFWARHKNHFRSTSNRKWPEIYDVRFEISIMIFPWKLPKIGSR